MVFLLTDAEFPKLVYREATLTRNCGRQIMNAMIVIHRHYWLRSESPLQGYGSEADGMVYVAFEVVAEASQPISRNWPWVSSNLLHLPTDNPDFPSYPIGHRAHIVGGKATSARPFR